LPGWNADRVEDAWPAFRVGCAAQGQARRLTRDLWVLQRPPKSTRDPDAIRAFFERHFIPYQVLAADGRDTGTVTGYYEPLLSGSRTKTARYGAPVRGAGRSADDRSHRAHPELRDNGCAAARKSFRTGRAPTSRTAGPDQRKGAGLRRDPVEAFFLQIRVPAA
jgi:membrane-bound lytic murein transglycosylase A